MANLNKVILIGRLTRDVEVKTFSNGGKVAKFGFAVTGERKKNPDTGKYDDVPCFLDVEVYNRGENGRSADIAEQYLAKGKQAFLEGHLRMDSWTAQDGQKRHRLVVVVDQFQFLEPKQDDGGGDGESRTRREKPASRSRDDEYAPAKDDDDDIPF